MTNLQAQKQLMWIFKKYAETATTSDGDIEAITMAISSLSKNGTPCRCGDAESVAGGNPARMVVVPEIPTKRR